MGNIRAICSSMMFYVSIHPNTAHLAMTSRFRTISILFESAFFIFCPRLDPIFRNIPVSFPEAHAKDSSSRLADLLMAVGSYFIMVRARDLQGGEVCDVGMGLDGNCPAAGDLIGILR